MKIAVVSDTCTALSVKEAEEQGIFLFPLQLVCDDQTYLDGVDITIKEFSGLLKQEKMPSTSCPPIGLVEEGFEKIKKLGYDAILCVPITRGLSATAQNFEAVAKQVGIQLHTIDLYSTCTMQYYVVEKIKEMIDQGLEFDDIIKIVEDCVDNSNTLVIADDLAHLKRGGRLTAAAATLGSLLKIKPILQLNKGSKGLIDVYDKVRTANKAYSKAIDDLNVVVQGDETYQWLLIHSEALELAQHVRKMIEERTGSKDILIREMPPVISAHTGLNCIGIQYIKKITF